MQRRRKICNSKFHCIIIIVVSLHYTHVISWSTGLIETFWEIVLWTSPGIWDYCWILKLCISTDVSPVVRLQWTWRGSQLWVRYLFLLRSEDWKIQLNWWLDLIPLLLVLSSLLNWAHTEEIMEFVVDSWLEFWLLRAVLKFSMGWYTINMLLLGQSYE